MPRKKLVAGNWKMSFLPAEAESHLNAMKAAVNTNDVDVVLCVPFVHLSLAQKTLAGTDIKVGAQNMHYADSGAYTGEVAGVMLEKLGVPYVIIGHSERREYFGETDTQVNLKALKALQCNITPIVCIGETLKQRESGRTFKVISKQLTIAIDEMTAADITKVVFAYEPIWAIGTGKTATKEQAEEVCAMIRKQISTRYGNDVGENVRILYGGSVTEKNANELFSMDNIDGGLVGGASLKPAFEQVVKYNS